MNEFINLFNQSNTIRTNKVLVKSLGVVSTIMLLSLLGKHKYYSEHNQIKNNCFFATIGDIESSTSLTRPLQKTAINSLEKLNLIIYNCDTKSLMKNRKFYINLDKTLTYMNSLGLNLNHAYDILDCKNCSTTLTVNRIMACKLGLKTGILLSALVDKHMNSFRTDDDYFKYNCLDIQEDTGLPYCQQTAPYRKLKAQDILTTRQQGLPCAKYFHLNFDKILLILQNNDFDKNNNNISLSYSNTNVTHENFEGSINLPYKSTNVSTILSTSSSTKKIEIDREKDTLKLFKYSPSEFSQNVTEDNYKTIAETIYEIAFKGLYSKGVYVKSKIVRDAIIKKKNIVKWAKDCASMWKKTLTERGSEIKNKASYLKACLFNWLQDNTIENMSSNGIKQSKETSYDLEEYKDFIRSTPRYMGGNAFKIYDTQGNLVDYLYDFNSIKDDSWKERYPNHIISEESTNGTLLCDIITNTKDSHEVSSVETEVEISKKAENIDDITENNKYNAQSTSLEQSYNTNMQSKSSIIDEECNTLNVKKDKDDENLSCEIFDFKSKNTNNLDDFYEILNSDWLPEF